MVCDKRHNQLGGSLKYDTVIMDRRDGDWNFWSDWIRGRAAAMCRMGEWRAEGRWTYVSNRRSSIRPVNSRESHCQADFGDQRPGVEQRVQRLGTQW